MTVGSYDRLQMNLLLYTGTADSVLDMLLVDQVGNSGGIRKHRNVRAGLVE
jgi:hypothetical protein